MQLYCDVVQVLDKVKLTFEGLWCCSGRRKTVLSSPGSHRRVVGSGCPPLEASVPHLRLWQAGLPVGLELPSAHLDQEHGGKFKSTLPPGVSRGNYTSHDRWWIGHYLVSSDVLEKQKKLQLKCTNWHGNNQSDMTLKCIILVLCKVGEWQTFPFYCWH